MAAGSPIRGSRIGAGPMGESARGNQAPRIKVSYWCVNGHETSPSFAVEAQKDLPESWDCPSCGMPGGPDRDAPPMPPVTTPYKTHLAYVKERRSDEDATALLDEALAALRERRGTASQ